MTEKIKPKKTKRVLTRKEAIRKGNKDFRAMARNLAKTMNSGIASVDIKNQNKK